MTRYILQEDAIAFVDFTFEDFAFNDIEQKKKDTGLVPISEW